jgi:hypothetical protein
MELRSMGHQHRAPAATGIRAVARLQPRGDVPHRDPVASAGGSGCARAAQLQATSGARQHGLQDDPGARRHPVELVEQLADHLVARHERHRDQRGEVERSLARQRGQVRAADAGQPGPNPGPPLAGRHGLVPVHQAQRRHRAGQQPRQALPHGSRRHVPRHRSEQLQRQHQLVPSDVVWPSSCEATSVGRPARAGSHRSRNRIDRRDGKERVLSDSSAVPPALAGR